MTDAEVAGPVAEFSELFRTFDLHVPLLESGKVTTGLAQTDILGCTLQVADSGGENGGDNSFLHGSHGDGVDNGCSGGG